MKNGNGWTVLSGSGMRPVVKLMIKIYGRRKWTLANGTINSVYGLSNYRRIPRIGGVGVEKSLWRLAIRKLTNSSSPPDLSAKSFDVL